MKYLLLILSLLSFTTVLAQSHGITYQAVLLAEEDEELPGIDVPGGILPNKSIGMRFSIQSASGSLLYQETQDTKTDEYGMINVVIGIGEVTGSSPGSFMDIDWDGSPIELRVDLDLKEEGSGFEEFSQQTLYFVPYAYHRNITATGTMDIEGVTNLNSDLNVNQNSATDLSGTLNVDGISTLNNDLQVTGGSSTGLSGTLSVDGVTDLNSSLNVNGNSPSNLSGSLTVDGSTDLNNTLSVDGVTDLNNILNVTGNSASNLTGALTVDGVTSLNSDLNLIGGGSTNLSGSLSVDGITNINNAFNVTGSNPSYLTGTLVVDGTTDINNNFNVTGASPTDLSGTLNVDGVVDINNILNVNDAFATNLSGALTVDGITNLNNEFNVNGNFASNLTGSLTVDGITDLNGETNVNNLLAVTSDNAAFIATIYNTNTVSGGGIVIKLGKQRTIFTPPSIPGLLSTSEADKFKDLIRCDFTGDKILLLGEIVLEGLLADVQMIAGLAVGTGNMIIDFLNTSLSLPYTFPGITMPSIDFPAISTPSIVIDVPLIPTFTIPGAQITGGFNLIPETELIPSFLLFPKIPNIDLTAIGIPSIPVNDLSFWGVPDLCFSDSGSPLNNDNEFIRFTDVADSRMGSIRAVSLSDWASNYLNPVFLYKLRGAITSAVDKKHARYHFKKEITAALKNYANIGVEYSSGNGDYAEWLERSDINETINSGDIVGVVGGKISKDLTNAEQVMVVSHNPIVLGNIPPEGKNHLGNNVAFMGQVPVKVMGPVETGDYILGDSTIPGYGIAKAQNEMTIEDFKNAVGRAWENDPSKGAKFINTVIGIHNGDYFKILKNYEEKFKETEARLESVESKVDALTEILINTRVNN